MSRKFRQPPLQSPRGGHRTLVRETASWYFYLRPGPEPTQTPALHCRYVLSVQLPYLPLDRLIQPSVDRGPPTPLSKRDAVRMRSALSNPTCRERILHCLVRWPGAADRRGRKEEATWKRWTGS